MELKDNLKKGCKIYTKKFGIVEVVNDSANFETYKAMGLDVFKQKKTVKKAK